jgi:hypothetical protein
MRKVAVILGGLALAGCGGVVPVVQSIFDQVNAFTKLACGYSFTFTTIDSIIKALGGTPIAETIGSLLCTQAKQLAAQQAPRQLGVTTNGQAAINLGTVIINGKPVTITVLQ